MNFSFFSFYNLELCDLCKNFHFILIKDREGERMEGTEMM